MAKGISGDFVMKVKIEKMTPAHPNFTKFEADFTALRATGRCYKVAVHSVQYW